MYNNKKPIRKSKNQPSYCSVDYLLLENENSNTIRNFFETNENQFNIIIFNEKDV